MTDNLDTRAKKVKEQAAALAFDACGIAPVCAPDPEDRLGRWLQRGYHAGMHWMARTKRLRQDVTRKLPQAKSVVVLARNYYYPRPACPEGAAKVSCYAWGRDYHKVLKKPLGQLATFLDAMQPDAQSFISVDSGPVLERAWAAHAGVGWIGKNSLVLRKDMGSWFFLGVIVTTVDLAPDAPAAEHCGTCTACTDACPTGAIVEPGVVDAQRCISYHTIENRGLIPREIQPKMSPWVFGCDRCQEVCPWNKSPRQSDEPDFQPRTGVANPDLDELAAMDEATFNRRFEGTPVRRAKHSGMVRNARTILDVAPGGLGRAGK